METFAGDPPLHRTNSLPCIMADRATGPSLVRKLVLTKESDEKVRSAVTAANSDWMERGLASVFLGVT